MFVKVVGVLLLERGIFVQTSVAPRRGNYSSVQGFEYRNTLLLHPAAMSFCTAQMSLTVTHPFMSW